MFWKRKQPYITYLPEPTDATIGILKHVVEKQARIPSFKMGLSSLEAPSTRLAIELFQREAYGHTQVVIDVAQLQQPDPRLPHGSVDFVLWHYDGTTPAPALPPRPGGIPYLDALVWCVSDSLPWLAEPLRSNLVRRVRAEVAP